MTAAPRWQTPLFGMIGAAVTAWPEEPPPVPRTDQSVVVNGVSWAGYCLMRELLDSPGIRLAYLEGALEIRSPSPLHEYLKKQIARLLEVFSLEREVPLVGYGSTTFRREVRERGAEPDECYCIGRELGDAPDIAIEVVLTSSGLNKLAIYAGLGVREVWFWRNQRFELHALEGEVYVPVEQSRLVPSLDFAVLAEFVRRPDQYGAALAFRDLLRKQPKH
jgi:Uma2 family endonuclease